MLLLRVVSTQAQNLLNTKRKHMQPKQINKLNTINQLIDTYLEAKLQIKQIHCKLNTIGISTTTFYYLMQQRKKYLQLTIK